MTARDALYFDTAADFRAWLDAHHDRSTEAWIGFRKAGSGLSSLTWPEAVDEALAYGWIDGVRQSVDAARYRIRFSPRKQGSVWSRVNLDRYAVLLSAGRIMPAGERAFAAGKERTDHYSYENEVRVLEPDEQTCFEAQGDAWAWFSRQPPSYRKPALWWVVSAKRPETRANAWPN